MKIIKDFLYKLKRFDYATKSTGLEILKFVGPGFLVAVGFIDPGNWASDLAAGGSFGYSLLWVVTLSTLMLILLQHNVAHLGIATGKCLSEATTKYISPPKAKAILGSAMLASISTSFAEVLGAAIALSMLFSIPIQLGACMVTAFVMIMLLTNSYRLIEKWIIGFVSLIGLSFIYELTLAKVNWTQTAVSWVTPSFPNGSWLIIMSVLGAVVMPHNLFLHSEIIQSRKWNRKNDKIIKAQLRYEFMDTLFSMGIGWAINSAIIILAAATFFRSGISIHDLSQAKHLLEPLLGMNAGLVFAIALLLAGIASAVTSGMAAGTIFAGFFSEPYNIKDFHSKLGVSISLIGACLLIFFVTSPFKALIISQMILSVQLPITVFTQIYLTSSRKVMGKYRNTTWTKILLYSVAAIITIFNIMLLLSYLIK